MVLSACEFQTERLLVKEWHSLLPSDWQRRDLAHVIAAMLTEPVTRSLPISWQGTYTADRARMWINERDLEGTTLLAINRLSRQAIGLLILFEMQSDQVSSVDIRIGYLLSESAWGRGIATELVAGFADWCRGQTAISTISAGVVQDNPASAKVLEKSGFERVVAGGEAVDGEYLYRLMLT